MNPYLRALSEAALLWLLICGVTIFVLSQLSWFN